MSIGIPKGTFDVVPHEKDPELVWRESRLWQYLERAIRELVDAFYFEEIRTPIFERTELFQRGVGESSDVVSKEMYTFLDKGERSMTLRPEMTASVMRAFIEGQMHTEKPLHKLFYMGPMFRYDRPQAGRYRQFHQFGVEVIGGGMPEQDVEMIDMLFQLYRKLGLKDLELHLNTVGDPASRALFREALKKFLEHKKAMLSEDSKVRLEVNPLRILDSKEDCDHAALEGAPVLSDFLNEACKEHFEQVLEKLQLLGISYNINAKLVRGLDYYTKTVFEITAGKKGAQNALAGGGRYDGLLKTLGGPDLPGVGFSTGLERVLQTMLAQNVPLPARKGPTLLLIGLGERAENYCFKKAHALREEGVSVEVEYSSKKLKEKLRYADHIAACFVLIVGDNELEKGQAEVKAMESRKGQIIDLQGLRCSILEDLTHALS